MSGGAGAGAEPEHQVPAAGLGAAAVHELARRPSRRAGRRAPGSPQRQDVNDEVLTSDPMLTFIAEKVLPLTRVPARAWPSTRRCRRRCSRRPLTSSSGRARPTRPRRRTRRRVEKIVGGADKVASDSRDAGRGARPRRARRRRRPTPPGSGGARAVGFVAPALAPDRACSWSSRRVWTLYIGHDQLPAHRRRGPPTRSSSGSTTTPTALDRPAVPQLAVAHAAVRARLGGHRPERARVRARLGAARGRHGWSRRIVEALVLLAWILPELGRRVPVDRAARPRRRHAERRCSAARAPPGWSSTRWLSIIVFNIWRGTAFSMMLYSRGAGRRAAVAAGDRAAGRRLGAAAARATWCFPHIRGHVLTNTLLISLWTFNDFTPFLLTAGGPDHESEIAAGVHLQHARSSAASSATARAISLLMLLINLVIALVYLRGCCEGATAWTLTRRAAVRMAGRHSACGTSSSASSTRSSR